MTPCGDLLAICYNKGVPMFIDDTPTFGVICMAEHCDGQHVPVTHAERCCAQQLALLLFENPDGSTVSLGSEKSNLAK